MHNNSAKHPARRALYTALLAGTALSCLVSCSKPAPRTPMERSRVLLGLFNNLDRRENEAALKNIETYRNLDPTNLFLSDFEHIVRANSVIESVRAKLDAGDIQGASEELDAYCLKYGQDTAGSAADDKDRDNGDPRSIVWDAKANVDLLLEAQRLNGKMLEARSSDDMRIAATDLRVFARKNFRLFPELYDYASEKIREADARAGDEKTDACVAIFQDLLDATAAGPKTRDATGTAALLAALLELNADPGQIAGFEAWLNDRTRESVNP